MKELIKVTNHSAWISLLNVAITTVFQNIKATGKREKILNLGLNGLYSLHSLAVKLNNAYKNPQPMNDLTHLEKIKFDGARICHICEMPFTDTDKRVRDHCHFTGK